MNQGQEFVIGGYTPAGRNFDAIIFGYYDDEGPLIYAARTRNGFTHGRSRFLEADFEGTSGRQHKQSTRFLSTCLR